MTLKASVASTLVIRTFKLTWRVFHRIVIHSNTGTPTENNPSPRDLINASCDWSLNSNGQRYINLVIFYFLFIMFFTSDIMTYSNTALNNKVRYICTAYSVHIKKAAWYTGICRQRLTVQCVESYYVKLIVSESFFLHIIIGMITVIIMIILCNFRITMSSLGHTLKLLLFVRYVVTSYDITKWCYLFFVR